jgi:tight adherence protein B
MLLTAVVLAGIAAALSVGRPRVDPWRFASAPRPDSGPASGPLGGPGVRPLRITLLVAGVLATWVSVSGLLTGTELGVAAVAAAAGLAVVRAVASGRRAEEARQRRRAVVDFCEALVGELRAGQPVLVALERSAAVWPEVGPAVSAARLDADLPAALRRLAKAPGADALDHLAAAWQLCAATGGGLTVTAGQVLEAVRGDAAALRQVEGEASSARATARLVAMLPVVVLTAGQGLGSRPWAFLLGTPVGVVCLAGGVTLVLAGLTWIDRIALSATSSEA